MSADNSAPPAKLGTPVASGPRTWVQTERAGHEAWARLTLERPRAAAVMHQLVANMGHQNAVVISQKTLAKLLGCNPRTVQRALDDLVAGRWVQVVRLNGPGTVAAYVVNSAVAWGEKREHLRLSVFHATVVADAEDQPAGALERADLRRLPVIYPPEEAMPAGDGEPGAQIPLPGLEAVVEGAAAFPSPADGFGPLGQASAAVVARSGPPARPEQPAAVARDLVAELLERLIAGAEGNRASYTLPTGNATLVAEPIAGANPALDVGAVLREALDGLRRGTVAGGDQHHPSSGPSPSGPGEE